MSSEEWRTLRVSDICTKVVSGGTPSTRNPDYYDGSIPWLKTQEINFNKIYETKTKITDEGLKNSSAKWIPENSVIMAMYGATAGKIAINKAPITTNQACCNLIINDDIADYRYIYYNLMSRFQEIASMAVGGAQQNLNAEMIRDLEIPLPSLSIQHRIADVLSTLDDKIELNRQTNATLEAIAQAIFKEWFVDFNYPGATGEMIDSPLGPIPKGWRVVPLTSELNIVYGKNLPTSKLVQKGYPVFGGNGLIGYFDRYIYEEPQVIVACRGAASGKINQSLPKSFITNNSLVFFIPESSNITFPFLKYFCLNTDFTSYVSGSAQPQLTIEALEYANLLLPDIELLAAFTTLVSIFESEMRENDIESSTLAMIRDELLGNLMNGDIDF